MNDSPAFARRFGEVYQTQWVYGDGSVNLVEEIRKIEQAGHVLATEHGLENIMEGAFRMFAPLQPTGPDESMLLVERYADLGVWAQAEMIAQRSKLWMGAMLANQDNPSTWLGDAWQMLDDALDAPRALTSERIAVDWTRCNPTKKVALVDLPRLVRELTQHLDAQGFTGTAVRYFAMTTAAGSALNQGHLWLEHESSAAMGEVLAWRQSAPELADWRRRFRLAVGEILDHQLFTQIG